MLATPSPHPPAPPLTSPLIARHSHASPTRPVPPRPAPAVLAVKKYNLADASDWSRWLVSCYFSLTTMLTIGG